MAFHVGQKVECVDDSPVDSDGFIPDVCAVKKGEIYHIAKVIHNGKGVWLAEIPNSPDYAGWQAKRFRAIVENKTDISIFTEMLKPKDKIRFENIPKRELERMVNYFQNAPMPEEYI